MDEREALLGELGVALHQATLPADVVEERLTAVAKRLGLEGQFFTLQSFFAMELRNGAPHATVRRMSFDTHWNLTRMTALLALSRELADGRVDVAGGRKRITEIAARPPPYRKPLVVVAYGVYGGAVAARVGGGVPEVIVGARWSASSRRHSLRHVAQQHGRPAEELRRGVRRRPLCLRALAGAGVRRASGGLRPHPRRVPAGAPARRGRDRRGRGARLRHARGNEANRRRARCSAVVGVRARHRRVSAREHDRPIRAGHDGPRLLQLAPGFLGTESVLRLLRPGESQQAESDSFFRVVVVALQLALGLLVAGLLFRKRRA